MPQANLNTPPPCQETRPDARTKPSLVQTLGLGLASLQTPEHTQSSWLPKQTKPNQNKTTPPECEHSIVPEEVEP